MKESLVCCSIPRNLLLKQDYDKGIDKAEHTEPVDAALRYGIRNARNHAARVFIVNNVSYPCRKGGL